MLVIRMQRTGRKGHAQFRVVVQDSRRTPTSGKVVARLGHFDPHTKQTSLDKEKAQFYLDHGAQPTSRVIRLLKAEKVKLPKWVNQPEKQNGKIKNPDKLRRNRPPEEKQAEAAEPETAETAAENPEAPTEAAEVNEPEDKNEEVNAVPEPAENPEAEKAAETEAEPEKPADES